MTYQTFDTLQDHICPQALKRGYLLPTRTPETLLLEEAYQVPNRTLLCHSQADSGCSLIDAQHSSKLYIPPDFQQTTFGTNSKSRNTSTEGIPPSTRMGSNLSLSRQSAMTRGSGSGYYPRSGSVNTASLEDDGTHFSMG